MSKSLNRILLIGNVTRDPELRHTASNIPVTTFSIATNRTWSDNGEQKTETEFHRILAWSKLAELTANAVIKGSLVFIEGRLQTRKWTDKEQRERTTTEIVANDVIFLDRKKAENIQEPAVTEGSL